MRYWTLALFTLFLSGPVLAQDDDRETAEEKADRIVELLEDTIETKKNNSLDRTALPENAEDREAMRLVYRALDSRRVTVNFVETPFADAVDFIRDISALNIVLSKKARELIEDEDVTVDLRLKTIKLRNCWELLLKAANLDLRYGIRHGVLFVGLKEEWEKEELILRFLPIGDLLHTPPDFPGPKVGLDADGITFDD